MVVVEVCLVGDSVGSVLGYDALCRAVRGESSEGEEEEAGQVHAGPALTFSPADQPQVQSVS